MLPYESRRQSFYDILLHATEQLVTIVTLYLRVVVVSASRTEIASGGA